MFWCCPVPLPDDEVLAGDTPAWSVVVEMSDLFRLSESQGAACEASGIAREGRIQFPVTLHVYASTLDDLVREAFPGNCAS